MRAIDIHLPRCFRSYRHQIEAGLRASRFVENICVCTDPYSNSITALICPNKRSLAELAQQLGKGHLAFEQQCDDEDISRAVMQSIQNSCQELEFKKREVPARIALVKEEWSQENNLLTAAFKMRRKQVNDFYRDRIRSMYDDIRRQETGRGV